MERSRTASHPGTSLSNQSRSLVSSSPSLPSTPPRRAGPSLHYENTVPRPILRLPSSPRSSIRLSAQPLTIRTKANEDPSHHPQLSLSGRLDNRSPYLLLSSILSLKHQENVLRPFQCSSLLPLHPAKSSSLLHLLLTSPSSPLVPHPSHLIKNVDLPSLRLHPLLVQKRSSNQSKILSLSAVLHRSYSNSALSELTAVRRIAHRLGGGVEGGSRWFR